MLKLRTVEPEEMSSAREKHGNNTQLLFSRGQHHVPTAKGRHAIINGLLEAVFSMWTMQGYIKGKLFVELVQLRNCR